jgi:hypothetical protein
MYIFQDIFPFIYGSQTIKRNRLRLTYEDALEYRTFESITSKEHAYKNSKGMLCTFHAIYKHFKEHIRPMLPKNGMMLTEKGHEYGEFIHCTCNQGDLNMYQFFYSFHMHSRRPEYVSTFIASILNIHWCIGPSVDYETMQ